MRYLLANAKSGFVTTFPRVVFWVIMKMFEGDYNIDTFDTFAKPKILVLSRI